MATRLIPPHMQFSDAAGVPYAAGELQFYETNTATPKDTFTSTALSVANPNPILLNVEGRTDVDIWGDGEYKLIVRSASGVDVGTYDPVLGFTLVGNTSKGVIADLTAMVKSTLTNNQVVNVGGYTTVGDGGGGRFYWDSASIDTANGFDIIEADEAGTGRWRRIYNGIPTIAMGGAKTDGTDIAPVIAAISTAIGKGIIDLGEGTFSFNPPIDLTTGITLKGRGYASAAGASATILKKLSGGDGITLTGDDSGIEDFEIDSNSQTGDGFVLTGSRAFYKRILTHSALGDGGRVGITNDGAGTINANLWYGQQLISINNGGYGWNEHHTNTTTGATFPQGVPDINSGTLIGADFRGNTLGGMHIGNAIDNKHYSITSQNNTGRGLLMTADARGHRFYGIYLEGNSAGTDLAEYEIQAGATGNMIDGERFGSVAPIVINTPGQANLIRTQLGTRWWAQNDAIGIVSTVTDGSVSLKLESSGPAGDVNAEIIGNRTGTTGGSLDLQTKADGGALTSGLLISSTQLLTQTAATGFILGKSATDRTVPGIHINESLGTIAIAKAGAITDTMLGFYRNASGTAVGSITTDSTSTAYNLSSDYRLGWKKNRCALFGSLDRIMGIALYDFLDVKKQGVIAHELQEVIPQAVTGEKDGIDQDGEMIIQQVDYSKIVPDLIGAIQSLEKRLRLLE